MKNYKLIINILLIFVFVASIISLALICPMISEEFDAYCYMISRSGIFGEPENEQYIEIYSQAIYSLFVKKLISIIFSALSAVASAVTFALLNFKLWKNKD